MLKTSKKEQKKNGAVISLDAYKKQLMSKETRELHKDPELLKESTELIIQIRAAYKDLYRSLRSAYNNAYINEDCYYEFKKWEEEEKYFSILINRLYIFAVTLSRDPFYDMPDIFFEKIGIKKPVMTEKQINQGFLPQIQYYMMCLRGFGNYEAMSNNSIYREMIDFVVGECINAENSDDVIIALEEEGRRTEEAILIQKIKYDVMQRLNEELWR